MTVKSAMTINGHTAADGDEVTFFLDDKSVVSGQFVRAYEQYGVSLIRVKTAGGEVVVNSEHIVSYQIERVA